MKKLKFLSILCLFIMACGPAENEDIIKTPPKDGAIQTTITTSHSKGFDILTTEHKVWIKGKMDKYIQRVDTLKPLGETKEEAEDNEGNIKAIMVSRDYEFYITVK